MVLDIEKKLKEFNEQQSELDPIGRDSRVLIVDSMNMYIRSFCATPSMNDNGDHIGGVVGYLKSVGAVIRQFNPTRVICVFDGKGGSQRRRAVYENYKNKSRTMERLNRTYDFNTPQNEQESMKWQLHLLIELLENLPVTVFAIDNIEADDTISYLVNLVGERGGKSTILSTDKDFLQLVSSSCEVYSPTKHKMYTVDEVVAEFGIHPNNFLLYRMLTGDQSDNIDGVKGIGPKTLLKFFPEVSQEKKITVLELVDKCKSDTNIKIYNKILSAHNEGILDRNNSLMNLSELLFSGTTKLKILNMFDNNINILNKYKFVSLLGDNQMLNSLGNFQEWFVMTWTPLTKYIRGKNDAR